MFKKLLKITLPVFASLLLFGAKPTTAEAAIPSISGLKQTDGSYASIQCGWDDFNSEDFRYEVSVKKGNGNWVAHDVYSNPATINNLEPGTTYQLRVRPYGRVYDEEISGDIIEYGDYSKVIDVVTAPYSKPSNIKVKSMTNTSISLTWDNAAGANAYVVEYEDTLGNKVQTASTNTNGITLKKLRKNARYEICVYGVRSTDSYVTETGYNSYCRLTESVGVKPSTPKVKFKYFWRSLGEINVDIEKEVSADGYEVQAYTVGKKEKKICTMITDDPFSVDVKSPKFKKYIAAKVRVRAYSQNSAGKKYYSGWSNWSYGSPQPYFDKLRQSGNSIRAKWDKIDGADRYLIYGSTKRTSGFKKMATASSNSCKITKGLKKNKTYYFYVIPQVRVGLKYKSLLTSDESRILSVTTYR